MKNVLHVIDTIDLGGAEKVMIGIVNGLPQYQHHIAYLGGKNSLKDTLPPTCKFLPLNFRSKVDSWRCARQLRQYIRQNDISIVHSHLVMATLIARMACPADVKMFNHIQSIVGARFFGPGKYWQRTAEKFFYRKRHHLIVVSEEVQQDYDKYIGIKGPVTVLPNFVETKFFAPGPRLSTFTDTLRTVAVGNLKPAKNYLYLLQAFLQLPKTIKLDIYGDGPQRVEMEEFIKINKLDNVRLCGSRNDVYTLLPGYDLYIMSSKVEGHPVALMEAMAAGLPAVVSDIKVLREATDGKGLYFDLGSVNGLVSLLRDIAAHKIDLDNYARFNFEWVKKSGSKERFLQTLDKLYS